MTDYKEISKKIDSIKNLAEKYKYCEKLVNQIDADEQKEFDLMMKLLPNGRSAYAIAIENGEIEFSEEMLKERLEVWKKCRKIIWDFKTMQGLGLVENMS